MLKFLDGKKMYITAVVTFIIGGLKASGIEVPEYVITMLGGFGIYALKDAIKKAESK